MRTDWSRTIDWDKGYLMHPTVRPEEQDRLVPRSVDDYTQSIVQDGATRYVHCPCDYGAEARCRTHGGYSEQAEPPTSVLDEAKAVIAERGENYDHPLPNHQRIAAMWSVILGGDVTPLQVVQCMMAVKLCRLIATPTHRDSLTDICGYAACAEQIIRADT